MASISAAKLFGKDTFKDVTIDYGGGREFKAHKLVLSENAEQGNISGTIELAGDPEAVEGMLRYIYTFDYLPAKDLGRENWDFHLRIAAVAERPAQIAELQRKIFVEFLELPIFSKRIGEQPGRALGYLLQMAKAWKKPLPGQ
ncbi:hypothetical protein B0A55_07347 [Friedmanniomyces simplex]|uniref:BTB domain-containing protein n=1 Tax=Friedmanniomyces simplex TaxID=329884 RepID=A0A4U0WXQ3_9PEZI|nr:hypothetical protein B0A55_07347 [Friedmanniomyces simplex]